MLTELFKNFTLLGAEWVLWLLVILSVLSIGVMIERFVFFRQRALDTDTLTTDLKKALASGKLDGFEKQYREAPAMSAQVAVAGLRERDRGIDAVSEAMNGEKVRARKEHERLLVVLGTLGNNAPFIGLFGTVLGIIKAFDDLHTKSGQGGPQIEIVHGGISEALVATAVGLMVAIPAVVAFNYFNRRIRQEVNSTDEIAHVILGEMAGGDKEAG